MDSQRRRQEIYDRIRETSKDEFILEEMKRLGFWGKQSDTPSLPEEMIKKEGDLQRELNALLHEKQRYNNKEEALKDMRRQRMAAAKEKRKATKEKKGTAKNTKSSSMGREKRKRYCLSW